MQNNSNHNLTPAQRQIVKALRDHTYLSYETIAAYCHCSVGDVQKLASEHDMCRSNGFSLTEAELAISPTLLDMPEFHNSLRQASDTLTEPQILDELANATDVNIRRAVATNINIWKSTADRLAQDRDGFVRERAVLHMHVEMFETLLRDPSEQVRAALAEHPDCPPAIMQKLLTDEDTYVRDCAAQHTQDTSLEAVAHILDGEESDVKIGFTVNTHCSSELLFELFKDKDPHVRQYVLRHPNFRSHYLRDAACDPDSNVRASLAISMDLPDDVCDLLSHDASVSVLVLLAGNPRLSEKGVQRLVQRADSFPLVERIDLKSALASNHHTAVKQLRQFLKDHSYNQDILQGIAENHKEGDTELGKLLFEVALAAANLPWVLLTLAENPHIARHTLVVLANSHHANVRRLAVSVLASKHQDSPVGSVP